MQIVMFAKYTTGAVEFFPCLCATAGAHTIFEEGLFRAPFGARGNKYNVLVPGLGTYGT